MSEHSELLLWLALWLLAAAMVVATLWRRRRFTVVGLVYTYLVSLWIIHWTGPAIYLSSEPHLYEIADEIAGLRESVWGVLGLGLGCFFYVFLSRHRPSPHAPQPVPFRLARIYLVIGAAAYVILGIIGREVPTATALSAVGSKLFIVAVCLFIWNAWLSGRRKEIVGWLSVTALVPLLSVVDQGFLGRGAAVFITIGMFLVAFGRPGKLVLVAFLAATYVAFSVYVSYFTAREDIRAAVWGGKAWGERIARLESFTIGIDWFDPGDPLHLRNIDKRLNQSRLLGVSVHYLTSHELYLHGETLWDAVLSLIPRVLWPEKTVFAGGGDVVANATGLTFSSASSVGVGHIMEFYINFGTAGVVAGSAILGFFLTFVDARAARLLWAGDAERFAFWMMVGISFLQVGGNMVQLVGPLGAAMLVSVMVNHYLAPLMGRWSGRPQMIPNPI